MQENKQERQVIGSAGAYCDKILNDFFNFCDGNLEKMSGIIDMTGISLTPNPPKKEQIKMMAVRCERTWIDFCNSSGLPCDLYNTLIERIRKRWELKLKSMKRVPKTSAKDKT